MFLTDADRFPLFLLKNMFQKDKYFLKIPLLGFLFFSLFFSPAMSAELTTDDYNAVLEYKVKLEENNVTSGLKTRIDIARNFLEVKKGNMTTNTFYKELSKMEMFDGLEPRHALMQVKKDIVRMLGTNPTYGKEYFFGKTLTAVKDGKTVGGGTEVERVILKDRRTIVMDAVEKVLADFKGQNVVDGVKYSVYLAEIGGWAKELPAEMKLSGDIDFSFFCGNVEIAMKLKKAYDDFIVKTYGMTPEQMDVPCTAHGKADYEVYVGKHGQAFAEKILSELKPINLDDDVAGKRVGEKGVNGKDALTDILMEAKCAKIPLINLKKVDWPTEPGISLEMIRHFEHDIAGKDVYSDIESFIKAAKYADRSNKALAATGAKVMDSDLSKFCTLLVERKHAPPDTLANIIREFFKKKGKPLPFEVDLTPSETGHTRGTLVANKKAIEGFWDICRKNMWDNANLGFQMMVDDLHARVATIDPAKITPDGDLTVKIAQFREMMEMQSRIMHSEEVGVKKIPKDFDKSMKKFRLVYDDFLKKAKGRAKTKSRGTGGRTTEEAKKVYEFVVKQLEAYSKTKGDLNAKMAVAAVVGITDQLNDSMDFMDNALFDDLKGGTVDTGWYVNLKKSQEVAWSQKINTFLGDDNYFSQYKLDGERQGSLDSLNKKFNELEMSINIKLLDNCVARGVRGINQSFNRSVAESTGGTYMMKGLALINLKDEIPVYMNLLYEGKWEQLGTELFRRRVPGGSAVENIVMGKYYAATWDIVTLVLPPATLFATAKSIGEGLAERAWEYSWSEELDKFTAALYESADFKLLNIDKVGDDIKLTNWRLDTAVYKGKKVDFLDFFAEKEQQIAEMNKFIACRSSKLLTTMQAGRRNRDNSACEGLKSHHEIFPTEYLHDGITGWFEVDSIFRENVGENDPFLMLVKEMKKHPSAGKKIKEYYKDMEDVRWEELKLAFMKHIKKELEKKKAAETSLLRGDIPKMLKELLKIARELKIEDEVKTNIKDTLGDKALRAILYIGDLLKGVKRTMMLEPDVWDEYEENAVVIDQYLKTYKRIHKNRAAAEKRLVGDLVDHDLRLLTGKYFLTGKDSKDQSGAQKWARLPIDQEVEAEVALRDIKERCKSEEPLDIKYDSETDSYGRDYDVYSKLVYHGTFREMWKYVYDNCSKEDHWLTTIARGIVDAATTPDDDWLSWGIKRIVGAPGTPDVDSDEAWNTLTGTDPNAKTDQDIAKERHEYHSKQIKELIMQFEAQYCTEENTKLDDLSELARQIEKLSQEALGLSHAATTIINSVKVKLEGVKKPLSDLEIKVAQIQSKAAQSNQIKANVAYDHSQVEQLTAKLGGVSDSLDKTSNYVCEKVSELQKVDKNSQRDAICRDIDRFRHGVRENYNLAKTYYRQIKEKRKRVEEELDKLKKTKKALDEIKKLEELSKLLKECSTELDTVVDKIASARQKVDEIPSLRKEAKDLAKVLKKMIKPMLRTEGGKQAMEGIKENVRKIDRAYKDSKNCYAKPDSAYEKLKPTFKNLDNRITTLEKTVERLRKLFGKPGEESEYMKELKEKLGLIEYVDSMAVRYVERIAMASADADYCFGMADNLRNKPVSYVIPEFRGQPVNQCLGILQRVGLGVAPHEQQDANHPDKEYAVMSTVPKAGIEVKIVDTTVTVNHYGALNVESYLNSINCDHIRGSYAAYNASRRKAFCQCPDGLVMNTKNTACINCMTSEQNFMNAYNVGNIRSAQAYVAEASNCSFAADAQSMINEMIRKQKCDEIRAHLEAAIRADNVHAANSLANQASAFRCYVDPALMNALNAANDRERQRQEEINRRNQQAIMDMWQNVFNPEGTSPGGGYYPPTEGGGEGSKDQGHGEVSSRNVNICVIDVNSIIDDHYDMYINGNFIGPVQHGEGKRTCYSVMLQPGKNKVYLKRTKDMQKGTKLKMDINNGEFSGIFEGKTDHHWSITAPMW